MFVISGTTLVECKSGYGLNLDTEVKMLKVIERGKRQLKIDVSSTYCGAHSVPKYVMHKGQFLKNRIEILFLIRTTDKGWFCLMVQWSWTVSEHVQENLCHKC